LNALSLLLPIRGIISGVLNINPVVLKSEVFLSKCKNTMLVNEIAVTLKNTKIG
jgi:hypothetical protein